MSRFVIIGILAILSTASAYKVEPQAVSNIEPYIFEDLINSTIESIRPLIPDPLRIESLSIDLPTDGVLTGGANISNFELTGLQSFQVPYLNLEILGMTLNFTFVLPSINLNTEYWADILLADLIPLYGAGKANFHIVNAELQGSGQADLSNGISVANLRIQIQVESATFDVHGALNNEDFSLILSSILNDVVASFIDNHQELISNILSPIIEAIINSILSGGDQTTTTEAPIDATIKVF